MNTERIAELERLESDRADARAEAIIRAFVGASLRMIEDAQERRPQLHPPARPHLYRAREDDPRADRPDLRAGDGALQGRARARAAADAARRAGVAHALHVRHPRLHARRHRHGAAHRRLQAGGPLRRAPARGAPHRVPRRRPARAAQDRPSRKQPRRSPWSDSSLGVTRRRPASSATSGCRSSGGPIAAGAARLVPERRSPVSVSPPTSFSPCCSSSSPRC